MTFDNANPLEIVWTSLGLTALIINSILLFSALVDAHVVKESGKGEPYTTLAARWVWVDLALVFWQSCFVMAGLVSASKPEPVRVVMREHDIAIACLFLIVQVTVVVAAVYNFKRRRFLNLYNFRSLDDLERTVTAVEKEQEDLTRANGM